MKIQEGTSVQFQGRIYDQGSQHYSAQ